MSSVKSYKITLIFLIVFALASMSFKFEPILKAYDDFLPQAVFSVQYDFYLKGKKKKVFVKTYLPEDNERQQITNIKENAEEMSFKIKQQEENSRGIWRSKDKARFKTISYSFIFKGKAIQYNLSDDLPITSSLLADPKYLIGEEHIQINNPKIKALANELSQGHSDLKSLIQSLYNYVYEMPSAPIRDLTDAVTALEQNQASCNGKARLFVALCRSIGIPARLKGGLILEETKKRTSHLWTELFVQDKWVPFDVLNGHFAYLPAHYIEIYTGDHFLITHTPNILFDYNYKIKKASHIPFINITTNEEVLEHPISLWKLSESGIMPKRILHFLLLLPFGGLLVALFKNVIGLKTYGVFLSVLIAFTLTSTGYVTGMLLFVLMTTLVVLISIPLNKWGLLYTPKIVVILTCSVFIILTLINLGIVYKIEWLMALSFFPIIILAIMAERFARAIVEDGYQKALKTILQTLIVTSFCYLVFSSVVLKTVLLVFPEIILIVIALTLMLGKWIGLRLAEYKRFRFILS